MFVLIKWFLLCVTSSAYTMLNGFANVDGKSQTWNVVIMSLVFSRVALNVESVTARFLLRLMNFMKCNAAFNSFFIALGFKLTCIPHTPQVLTSHSNKLLEQTVRQTTCNTLLHRHLCTQNRQHTHAVYVCIIYKNCNHFI